MTTEPLDLEMDILSGVLDFEERVLPAYTAGAGADLPADAQLARSIIPPATACGRDFSYVGASLPRLDPLKCVGCMECVSACPDSALLATVLPSDAARHELATRSSDERGLLLDRLAETRKYTTARERQGKQGGLFGLFVDPQKCKGCAECVSVCGVHEALVMEPKSEEVLAGHRRALDLYQSLPPVSQEMIEDGGLADAMLAPESRLYVGGGGSCTGCGESTALRMMLAATGYRYGRGKVGIVAATGCSTVYGSTYPYNPYLVSWTNSLFENAPAVALGVRARWDQLGWKEHRLWVTGGDGAMLDIGLGSLSRLLASGMDIKVLVLDTQAYSNTGGQASTASYTAQEAKLASYGTARKGKRERRKELGVIALMHPEVFVAQTVTSDPNHFYRAIVDANEFPGPAVVSVYATCQPEHGVADDASARQARLARDTRTFPVFVYDPRKGATIAERLSLRGNPSIAKDWHTDPHTGQPLDFIAFARTEGRFARHFGRDGQADESLQAAQADRLRYWRLLRELAGGAVEG